MLVDQIIALGVTLYHNLKAIKYRRKVSSHGLAGEREVLIRASEKNVTLGITEKNLSLVNETHKAYCASIQLD